MPALTSQIVAIISNKVSIRVPFLKYSEIIVIIMTLKLALFTASTTCWTLAWPCNGYFILALLVDIYREESWGTGRSINLVTVQTLRGRSWDLNLHWLAETLLWHILQLPQGIAYWSKLEVQHFELGIFLTKAAWYLPKRSLICATRGCPQIQQLHSVPQIPESAVPPPTAQPDSWKNCPSPRETRAPLSERGWCQRDQKGQKRERGRLSRGRWGE